MMLLDTHVLLWFREGATKLGRSACSHLMRIDEPVEVWRQCLLDDQRQRRHFYSCL
jgi:PIN domain nuclease of toxin-antitoxin system